LLQKTRSNASTDKQTWKQGPATLNPLKWHCFRFALGHHLFQHLLPPYDEKSAQDVAKLLPRLKEQASITTATTHPLFMASFTPDELKNKIKQLLLDKSLLPGPSGITDDDCFYYHSWRNNVVIAFGTLSSFCQIVQAGDTDLQGLILLFSNSLRESHTEPTDWQLSFLQPIYKGHRKEKTDPASYRGIYLHDTFAKLFEGLLITRLTTHTELLNTLTDSQLGTKPDTQTHDAIFPLSAIIQHSKYTPEKPTCVAIVDYSTAYPCVQ